MCDPAYLATRRARLWTGGHQTMNVSIQALYDAMKAVHEGALPSELAGAAAKDVMAIVSASADYDAATRSFLGS